MRSKEGPYERRNEETCHSQQIRPTRNQDHMAQEDLVILRTQTQHAKSQGQEKPPGGHEGFMTVFVKEYSGDYCRGEREERLYAGSCQSSAGGE